MNHSDIRKHLKKGELATGVLEALGYTYAEPDRGHPHWVAPENPLDAIKEAIQVLIKDGVEKGVKDHMEALKADPKNGVEKGVKDHMEALKADPKNGPNWHLVADMVNKKFIIRPENIPLTHPLRDYGRVHFEGKQYIAQRIEYVREVRGYTGYVVYFNFQMRPYGHFTEQRLPLSCAAFQQ